VVGMAGGQVQARVRVWMEMQTGVRQLSGGGAEEERHEGGDSGAGGGGDGGWFNGDMSGIGFGFGVGVGCGGEHKCDSGVGR
jgi:hypothetical protein